MRTGTLFGDLEQPLILVVGLGESGLALARFVKRTQASTGATLRLADSRETPSRIDELRAEFVGVDIVTGSLPLALLDDVDVVGLSPGLSPHAPPAQALVAEAAARGIPVWSEVEFFANALRALQAQRVYSPRCVGITGTNGKTTVTSMVAQLARHAGLTATAAGNISPSVLDALGDAIEHDRLPDVWALELSSFQLETTHSLELDAAALLNITEDHLDWHGSLDEYTRAKARIFAHAAVRIANRDDGATLEAAGAQARTFGLDAPAHAGDFGVVEDAALRWLARAEALDEAARPARRRAAAAAAETPFELQRLMPADALRIAGDHNVANALAALALVDAIGVPMARALHALREFRGLPHRVEHVGTVNGVDYIDDSKGTNVGATVAALDGLRRRCVLIAGGDGKGQDFRPLAAPVERWCRAAVLIGRDARAIGAVLEAGVPVDYADSLGQAVERAAALAQPGEAVLMSPACASLDMFRNYGHRAEVFVAAMRELALAQGQPC